MYTVYYAHVVFEGKQFVFIREPEGILWSKNTKDERERELKIYRQYFAYRTVVLFHEDERGVRTFFCNKAIANKLAKLDFSNCEWKTLTID
jgi:hypothetical protein